MATNKLLPFATSATANLVGLEEWESDTQRVSGFQSGIAESDECNRVFAQGANTGYAVGQLIADYANKDADLEPTALYSNMKSGIIALIEKELLPDILLKAHPVGSVYESTKSASPATLFGGTWQRLDDGRVLVAAGSRFEAGTTGGEFTHTLSTNEMPSHTHTGTAASAGNHNHSFSGTSSWNGDHTHSRGSMNITGTYPAAYDDYGADPTGAFYFAGNVGYEASNGHTGRNLGFDASRSWSGSTSSNGAHNHTISGSTGWNGNHTHSVTVSANGSGQAHNNVQPYLSVYRWIRTA